MIKQSIPINKKLSQTNLVLKRFPIITSLVLVASILNGLTAEGSNFSTGALLNPDWTCINPKLGNGPGFDYSNGISKETYQSVMKEMFRIETETWHAIVEPEFSKWAPAP